MATFTHRGPKGLGPPVGSEAKQAGENIASELKHFIIFYFFLIMVGDLTYVHA